MGADAMAFVLQKQNNGWYANFTIRCNLPLLSLSDLFRGMGAWRKTMVPQKPGNSPRPEPEVVKGHRGAKERAAQSPSLDSEE